MKQTLRQAWHERMDQAIGRVRNNRAVSRLATRFSSGSVPQGVAAGIRPTRAMATQQRLDPLGALAAWPLAPVLALLAVGYAVTATILQADEIQSPLLAVLAVVSMAAAGGALVFGALPARAPFEPAMHLAIVGLAVGAHLFEQASMWGHNLRIQDDFGPIGTGLLLLALAPYRPWREIAFSGAVASVIFGSVAAAQAPYLSIDVPPMVYAVIAGTAVLAPAVAGAAYSRRIVRSILEWQSDARRAVVERTQETRGQVAQSVVAQQLTTLRAGVIPFLTDVLERGEVTPSDIERAGELADEVRRTLVAEAENTWLDAVVARERAARTDVGLAPLFVVADPERRANDFAAEQRAATAALIVAVCGLRGFDPRSLVVQVTGPYGRGNGPRASALRDGALRDSAPRDSAPRDSAPGEPAVHAPGTVAIRPPAPHDSALYADTVTIQAGVDLPARQLRAALRPYLGVLRVLFVRVKVTVRQPLLTIQFDDARDPQQPQHLREAREAREARDTRDPRSRDRRPTAEDGYPE
jgi:hypothetical protein